MSWSDTIGTSFSGDVCETAHCRHHEHCQNPANAYEEEDASVDFSSPTLSVGNTISLTEAFLLSSSEAVSGNTNCAAGVAVMHDDDDEVLEYENREQGNAPAYGKDAAHGSVHSMESDIAERAIECALKEISSEAKASHHMQHDDTHHLELLHWMPTTVSEIDNEDSGDTSGGGMSKDSGRRLPFYQDVYERPSSLLATNVLAPGGCGTFLYGDGGDAAATRLTSGVSLNTATSVFSPEARAPPPSESYYGGLQPESMLVASSFCRCLL